MNYRRWKKSGTVNKVILIGDLGRDPEVHTTQSSTKIVTLALATTDSWRDRQSGERKERTEWHRVVIFNEPIANLAERFLRTGQKIYVEGSLRTRKWTDQTGQERITTEIVLARFHGELTILSRNTARDRSTRSAGAAATNPPVTDAPKGPDLDDEIPF